MEKSEKSPTVVNSWRFVQLVVRTPAFPLAYSQLSNIGVPSPHVYLHHDEDYPDTVVVEGWVDPNKKNKKRLTEMKANGVIVDLKHFAFEDLEGLFESHPDIKRSDHTLLKVNSGNFN